MTAGMKELFLSLYKVDRILLINDLRYYCVSCFPKEKHMICIPVIDYVRSDGKSVQCNSKTALLLEESSLHTIRRLSPAEQFTLEINMPKLASATYSY